MINWREKFRAFYLHFLTTLALAIAAAALVFFVWFPDPFQTMMSGTKFFALVAVCDLVLGPLSSLIVYNSKKTRRALVFDYTVIGIVQLTAFVYGVVSMANSRPIYVAFVQDQLEVIAAADIDDADLKDAKDPYRSRPKWGPVLVGTKGPTDREERNNLLFSGLFAGKDRQHFPRYYVPYQDNLEEIKRHARTLDELEQREPKAKPQIAAAVEKLGMPRERLRWLLVRSPRGFWTALLDAETGLPVRYLPVDPYE
jgi:hypothetical protein